MAPNTRASRAASRNTSRPSTPLDASSIAPASSFSEPARPTKQRKTGRNTRVVAGSVQGSDLQDQNGSAFTATPESALDQNSTNGVQSEPPTQAANSWTEPPLPVKNIPSYIHDNPKADVRPERLRGFGDLPTTADYEGAGLKMPESIQDKLGVRRGRKPRARAPEPNKTRGIRKARGGRGSARATPNGGDRPKSSASSADGNAQPVISRPTSRQNSLPRGGGMSTRSTRSTRSRTNHDIEPTDAVPDSVPDTIPVNGHEIKPPAEVRGLKKYTPQQLLDIMGVAITHADSLNDPKVADGLRHIKEASSSDPFLFTAVEGALNKPIDPHDKAVFQTTVRDAIKKVEAKAQQHQSDAADATEMERSQSTRSGTTSSSLSTAKSLDAETFAPTLSSEPAPAQGKRRGRQPKAKPKAKGRGKGRGKKSAEPESESIEQSDWQESWEPRPYDGPPRPNFAEQRSQRRKRRLQEDPEFSEETLATKRIKLSLTQPKQPSSTQSHVRTAPDPVPLPPMSPNPSSICTSGSERNWEVPEDEPVRRAERRKAALNIDSRPRKRQRKTKDQADEMDNIDFCRTCGGNGNLLCCDGCIDSFHFTCLDPPQDPKYPPEGKWFCPSCANKGPFGTLMNQLDDEPRGFQLPDNLRNFFEGVSTAKAPTANKINAKHPAAGSYVGKAVLPEIEGRGRTKRAKNARDVFRTEDDAGNPIFCIRCRRSADGVRPVILCDYCPCWWHLDCLDPPLTNPPPQKPGSDNPDHYWRCPNHIENVIEEVKQNEGFAYPRLRRPREPKYVDIDVIPNQGEIFNYTETQVSGVVYRVPDTGIILDFISSVKRKHAEEEAAKKRALAAERAAEAARQQQVINNLPTSDRDAIMSLMAMSNAPPQPSNPYSERMGQLVNELVSNAPEDARNQTSDVELLKSLQDLVNRRIQSLTPAESATSSN